MKKDGDKMCFVVDTSKSPYALLRPVSCKNVEISGLLGSYLEMAAKVTVPSQYEMLEDTGRMDNFRRTVGKVRRKFKGWFFNDSDVYKWVEGAAYSLIINSRSSNLRKKLTKVINEIKVSQDEDGYLNTYFTFDRKSLRLTNLKDLHELYCAGHLIQAAIASKRAIGERALFKVAKKFADKLVNTFGIDKKEGTSGHPEIEMALVELYRETQDARYLELAKFFLRERGRGLVGGDEYHIDHIPFIQLRKVTGHAVRMLYLLSGATDIYLETGGRVIFETLNSLWNDLVYKKMYITGGVGSRHKDESIGEEYELPNSRAYAETCAAIANFMWNWRMLLATGNSKFADVMEQTLYNGLLSGISLNGKDYFYVNPLEDRGNNRRQSWYEVACCPTNLARFIPSLPGYIYNVSKEGIWVNFYESGNSAINFRNCDVNIRQVTNYPWEGQVDIEISTNSENQFTLFLRKPGWFDKDIVLNLDGMKIRPSVQRGYLAIKKVWKGNHHIFINFPMEISLIESHPLVRGNVGKVSIKRGPITYCLEGVDNPDFDVWKIFIKDDSSQPKFEKNFLGGVITISGKGIIFDSKDWGGNLYLAAEKVKKKQREVTFKAIPYYAWANREPSPMVVWLNRL